jgi:hypothetical protein
MLRPCDQNLALGYTPDSYSLQNQRVDTFAIAVEQKPSKGNAEKSPPWLFAARLSKTRFPTAVIIYRPGRSKIPGSPVSQGKHRLTAFA